MDVALVTYCNLPELTGEDRLLLAELESRGLRVAPTVWDDPTVDWASFSLCVLRETWDYHVRIAEFLAWVNMMEREATLLNSPGLVRWNSHKGYMADLEKQGVPIAPTIWLETGTEADFNARMLQRGWDRAVIKPTVSASSFETHLYSADDPRAQEHLTRLLAERDVIMQEFLVQVQSYGERSLIFIDGQYTHAVRRPEPFMDDGIEHVSSPVVATWEEKAFARQVLQILPEEPLYARVDIAPGNAGSIVLMELELIEPSLFFEFSPGAVQCMADAIEQRLRAPDTL